METESAEVEAKVAEPRVVAVKFRNAGRTYDYDAGALELARGDRVLVEFGDTQVVGTIVRTQLLAGQSGSGHPKIVRRIGAQDEPKLREMQRQEQDAFKFALQKLRARNLPAKMVAAELSFSEDKLTLYVASEERIDLRGWIRDVSTQFRARIDVRQIGARDAAKFIGGIGSCGRELCCSTWLVDFRPVSIKMAKDQNLALNPEKVSGQCGRLLCCLTYEQDTYRDMRKGLPKIGKRVYTPLGDGRVKDVNVLRRRVRVQLLDGYEEFDAEQVSPMFGQKGELLQPSFGEARNDVDDEDDSDTDEASGESAVSAEAEALQREPAPAPPPAREARERPPHPSGGRDSVQNRPAGPRPFGREGREGRDRDRGRGGPSSREREQRPGGSSDSGPRRDVGRPDRERPEGQNLAPSEPRDPNAPREGGRRRRRRRGRGGRGGGGGGTGPSGGPPPPTSP